MTEEFTTAWSKCLRYWRGVLYMLSPQDVEWVPLPDSESAVPSGSIWLGPVDPTDVVMCTIRVRPGVGTEPYSADGRQTDDVHHSDQDLRDGLSGVSEADPNDLDRIKDFAGYLRLDIVEIDPQRRSVVLSGTAAAVADAFRVQLGRYRYSRQDRLGYIAPIYVPATIADIVEEICGLDDSPPDPLSSVVASNGAWRVMRPRFVIPLLALVVGSALGVSVYERLTSERSPSSPSTTARPPLSLIPSLPPVSRSTRQEPDTAGWKSLQAGRLQDAQDYFLKVLAFDPNRPKAMQGLVAVRRRMAGDDPQVIRKQMAVYQDAIRQGSAPGVYYAPPALELLVSASLRALREIEAQGGRAALSPPTPVHGVTPIPNLPGPPPPSPRTQDPATRQPPYTAAAPRSSTQPASVPPKAQDSSTKAPAPASASPPTRERVVTPPPQGPPVTTPSSPSVPATAPQASLPASSRLYTVRIGPLSDDRAAAIANQLSVGGFSKARLGAQPGYRVVSEPLPHNEAASLVTTLAGRGIHSKMARSTGDTVQIVFGMFASQRDAEALSGRIAAAGYEAWVRAGTLYTLLLGPYPSSSVDAITEIVKAGDPEAAVVADPVP